MNISEYFVPCVECVYFSECPYKERFDGCVFGDREALEGEENETVD